MSIKQLQTCVYDYKRIKDKRKFFNRVDELEKDIKKDFPDFDFSKLKCKDINEFIEARNEFNLIKLEPEQENEVRKIKRRIYTTNSELKNGIVVNHTRAMKKLLGYEKQIREFLPDYKLNKMEFHDEMTYISKFRKKLE